MADMNREPDENEVAFRVIREATGGEDGGMLHLKGGSRGGYFHVECSACGAPVSLRDLRWVGGVPQVKARCDNCEIEADFKLHPPTWMDVVPGP